MYEIFSFGRIPFGLHMDDLEAQRRIIAGYLPGSRPSYAPVKFYNNVFLRIWKKVNFLISDIKTSFSV